MKRHILILVLVFLASCTPVEKSRASASGSDFLVSGDYFLPVGENIAWASGIEEYGTYFRKLHDAGGNIARVIMVPWDTHPEWTTAGRIDEARAERIQEILELAQANDILVILSLDIYGELRQNSTDPREMLWDENPYNARNGGPCSAPEEFFTDTEARRLYRNRLDYILNRYGTFPIFAYELWNEADLTDNYDEEAVAAWHREMAEYIRKNDPYGHLVTTSFANPSGHDAVWQYMDFTQIHYHGEDVPERIVPMIIAKKSLGKPVLVTEFSLGNTGQANLADPSGIVLHDVMWTAAMMGTGAMPWWWDEYIDSMDLYTHFSGLSSFWEGEELNGGYVSRSFACSENCTARAIANITRIFIYAGCGCPNLTLPGTYSGELWDTVAGTVLADVDSLSLLAIPARGAAKLEVDDAS